MKQDPPFLSRCRYKKKETDLSQDAGSRGREPGRRVGVKDALRARELLEAGHHGRVGPEHPQPHLCRDALAALHTLVLKKKKKKVLLWVVSFCVLFFVPIRPQEKDKDTAWGSGGSVEG